MQNKFLTIGIVVSTILIASVGLFVASTNTMGVQTSPNVAVGPRPPPPSYDTPFGQKVSLQEAAQRASASGYRLMNPSYVPAGYALNGVWAEISAGMNQQEAANIVLVYAPTGTPPDITIGKARDLGYLVIRLGRAPPNFEQNMRQSLNPQCQVGQAPGAPVGCKKTVIGKEVSVNGKFAVYSPGWPDDPLPLRQFTWVDGNTAINLYGDASKFSFEDLMRMAESAR